MVGPNGVGKSTLLGLITGELEPVEGEIVRNRFLRIGRYSQHFVDVLPMDMTPVELLASKFGATYQDARNTLGRFGLGGHAHTIPMRDLSGGQKARVVFTTLALGKYHLLVLDEPTNHLDIESIDALADAINAFNGGVVLVSHDARLIQATDCALWIVNNKNATPWHGTFDEYRESLLEELHEDEKQYDVVTKLADDAEEVRLRAARERAAKIKAMREAMGGGAAAARRAPAKA
jgi:ATP-binding cassette subfamily F protein 1